MATRTAKRIRWIVCLSVPAALLVSALVVAIPAVQAAPGGVEKVTICHVPPGNPDNSHEIVVGAPAVPAHLAHGDFLGDCDGDIDI